jgi:hypothetical protein
MRGQEYIWAQKIQYQSGCNGVTAQLPSTVNGIRAAAAVYLQLLV